VQKSGRIETFLFQANNTDGLSAELVTVEAMSGAKEEEPVAVFLDCCSDHASKLRTNHFSILSSPPTGDATRQKRKVAELQTATQEVNAGFVVVRLTSFRSARWRFLL